MGPLLLLQYYRRTHFGKFCYLFSHCMRQILMARPRDNRDELRAKFYASDVITVIEYVIAFLLESGMVLCLLWVSVTIALSFERLTLCIDTGSRLQVCPDYIRNPRYGLVPDKCHYLSELRIAAFPSRLHLTTSDFRECIRHSLS